MQKEGRGRVQEIRTIMRSDKCGYDERFKAGKRRTKICKGLRRKCRGRKQYVRGN